MTSKILYLTLQRYENVLTFQ